MRSFWFTWRKGLSKFLIMFAQSEVTGFINIIVNARKTMITLQRNVNAGDVRRHIIPLSSESYPCCFAVLNKWEQRAAGMCSRRSVSSKSWFPFETGLRRNGTDGSGSSSRVYPANRSSLRSTSFSPGSGRQIGLTLFEKRIFGETRMIARPVPLFSCCSWSVVDEGMLLLIDFSPPNDMMLMLATRWPKTGLPSPSLVLILRSWVRSLDHYAFMRQKQQRRLHKHSMIII